MHLLLLLAMLLAPPFWESKSPREWSDEDLLQLLTNSPWAQTTAFRDNAQLPVYLCAAKPMREAEEEMLRRYTTKNPTKPAPDMGSRNEYLAYLEENPGKSIIIAVREPNLKALAEAAEVKQMEEESRLKAGGKTYRVTGYFPPAPTDPVLRIVFPRPPATVKELNFELYIPGVTGPYRQANFRLKDLTYRGQLEY